MDFKDIKIPFLEKDIIKHSAEKFKQEYWSKTIPIDIEKIIDVKLKIFIIPTPGLEKFCNTDALISSDWKSIYVDEDNFNDERYFNRLRFSLAHEIGHYILHKDIYENFKIKSFEDFYHLVDDLPGDQYNRIETQAHIFASHLLIPREKLQEIKQNFLNSLSESSEIDFEKTNSSLLNDYLAKPISKIFQVSADAMVVALNDLDG